MLVQGCHELHIGAVAVVDENVLEQGRRTARSVAMIVIEPVFPKDPAVAANAGRAECSKVDIDLVPFQNGSGRGMAVLGMDAAHLLLAEDLQVMEQFSVAPAHAQGSQRTSFVHRGGQPDLIALNDR